MGRSVLLTSLLTLVTALFFCRGASAGLCSELISPNGYSCNEHQAVTNDGFILGLSNIPSSGSPVLLMHGLLGGGDNFCLNSPSQSLAFILSDAGYDVWLGNNRCIQWSYGHQIYVPSENSYWDWTYDELASYDLEALTAFVYNQRGQLAFVGHSQGVTMLLAGLTGSPYNSQVLGYLKAAVFLAPVASVGHLTASISKEGLQIYADTILPAIGVGEFDTNLFANLACDQLLGAANCENVFSGLIDSFVGQNSYVDASKISYYNKYYPQSTSSYNIDHFGQSYRTNTFEHYNFGSTYDLSAFPSSLPLQIWSGGIDGLADPTDVASLLGQLPSSNRETHYLPEYGHLDFVIGLQANSDIYPSLERFLQSHA